MGYFARLLIFATCLSGVGSAVQAETVISVTQRSYDAAGRPLCVAVRMNPPAYNPAASQSSLPDACSLGPAGPYGQDQITHNVLDAAGQVREVDQAYGVPNVQRAYARYTYNPNGTKATETDAGNNTTTYIYDGFDRLQTVEYPSTTAGSGAANTSDYDQFGYDNNSNKTSWRRRNGITITYGYDALNRETTRSVSDGSVQTVYSGYDLENHLLYARYGSASGAGVTNIYDGLGRLVTAQDMNGRWIWLGYKYPNDALTALVYQDGYGVNMDDRDALNRVKTAYFGSGSNSVTVAQFSYDNLGRLTWMGRGASSAAGALGYGYDNLGRMTSQTQDLAGTAYDITWNWAFTPANQIASTTATSSVYDYKETSNATVNKTYDGLNRDQTLAVTSGGYDNNGNLGNDGTRLFYYDVYNRLTGVGATAYPQNGPYLTFTYDPLGRLASQTYYGTTTQFQYDGTNLIGEYDGNGNLTERYVHADGVDDPIAWFHGAGISNERFFIQDYHGSVIGYTDAGGNLQTLYKYGPYGEPEDINNGNAFTSQTLTRFGYTGQVVLREASLYDYKARVYDPIMGHFLQTDPIGSKDDLDLYAYTGDDPVDRSDSTGDSFTDYVDGNWAEHIGLRGRGTEPSWSHTRGYNIGVNGPPPPPGIGHNGGPALEAETTTVEGGAVAAVGAATIVGLGSFAKAPNEHDLKQASLYLYPVASNVENIINDHMTIRDLIAARLESMGKTVAVKSRGDPYDHIGEVRDAQAGLVNQITRLKNLMSSPSTTAWVRDQAQATLSRASIALDFSKNFLP